jgi:hypothetical protein
MRLKAAFEDLDCVGRYTGTLESTFGSGQYCTTTGHTVAVHTSAELKPLADAARVPFISEISGAKTFVGHFIDEYPERARKVPGMEVTGSISSISLRERSRCTTGLPSSSMPGVGESEPASRPVPASRNRNIAILAD